MEKRVLGLMDVFEKMRVRNCLKTYLVLYYHAQE